MTVGPASEFDILCNIDLDAFNLSTSAKPSSDLIVRMENFHHVKDLRIASTFHYKLRRRCTHPTWDVGNGRPRNEPVKYEYVIATNDFGEQLSPVFLALDHNQLQSFRYLVGEASQLLITN